jgi:DNA helicase-2/ATP-dependent DNA helicase PcrA
VLDFGDLIFNAYVLLDENSRIRQRYQERFKYILVDEFQDTNQAQFDMLCLLARDDRLSNVTVVGDDKQAIYGWRNARVENVDDFKADIWGGQSLDVSKNYRSYGEILEAAHYSIIQDGKFRQKSDSIKLYPERLGMADEPKVLLYEANSREREAAFIAQEIVRLLKTGTELDEIAVLMRGLRAVKVYEDALREAQIPYKTTGGTGFYDRREIKDILAYLMVIDNPFDETALIRALKRPPIGLNDLSLYRLRRRPDAQPQSREDKSPQPPLQGGEMSDAKLQSREDTELFDALSHADKLLEDQEAVRRIDKFLSLLEEMWKIMGEGSIFYLASQLVERSGYLKYVYGMSADDRERSLANIRKLLRMASEFERKHIFSDLRDFVQYVQFSMDQLVVEGEAGSETGRKAVQIMTVHQAKGLEFDVVFVINAVRPSFPTDPRHPMFAFHKDDGLIINADRDGDKFLKFKPYDLKKNSHLYHKHGIVNHYEQFRREHLGEERRIWYVGMTRARYFLYLSCPKVIAQEVVTRDRDKVYFFQIIRDGFADLGKIWQFRSFTEEDDNSEIELPLWKGRDEPAFKNVEEAQEYGKRLMDLLC